ncbi:MAG: DUF2325 domain-containing protein, partial [Deltaproteobacteria bacterium]|nr:DUF2325 domain-containing protein [Deltaproteobacteria bacterium]
FGGMDRLERHYLEEAAKFGVELKVYSRSEARISPKIRNVDAMLIFTNKVSHQVKTQAMNMAKAHQIPVFMHHSCGICTLRECLGCLNIKKGGVRSA